MLLLAAALVIAGPGTAALQAGEAPPDRGQPSEPGAPSERGPRSSPGQQPGEDDDAGTAEDEEDAPSSGTPDGSSDTGTGSQPDTGTGVIPGTTSGGVQEEPEPPPPPQPDLTGTRVLRSHLGPAIEAEGSDGDVLLHDLRIVVTETAAAGIDGGWWVTVIAPGGEIALSPLETSGDGGIPRTAGPSAGGGSLFSVAGQRSDQRYRASYEARGTLGLPRDAASDRPVVTILLVQ